MQVKAVLRGLIGPFAAAVLVASLYATVGLGSSTGLSQVALVSSQHPELVGQAVETSSTSTNPSWSGPTNIRLPSNAARDSGVGKPVEFCSSTGNCELLNTYGTNGIVALYAQVEAGGNWKTPTQLHPPANSIGGVSLTNLTCTSAGNCEAVGTYQTNATNNPTEPFAITETNGTWGTGVELSLPAGFVGFSLSLTNLTCSSAGNCAVVGIFDTCCISNNEGAPFAITETNGTWGTGVVLHLPGNSVRASLSNVTCSSAGNCEVVGSYTTTKHGDFTTEAFAATETSGTWGTGVELSLPSNVSAYAFANLANLACSSFGNCEAVGSYFTNPYGYPIEAFAITETDGTWGTGAELNLPANASSYSYAPTFSNLTCSPVGNCEAVGTYQTNATAYTIGAFAITETNGTWGTGVELNLPANASSIPYTSTCSSVGNCELVGNYDFNNPSRLFAITETSGTWGTGVELTVPANTSSTYQYQPTVSSLTCSSAASCEVVGSYYTNASNNNAAEPFAITETGGTWGAGVELALPANAVSSYPLNFPLGLACSSAGNCEAVGIYAISSINNSGSGLFAATETNGTWGTGVELTLPANSPGPTSNSNLICSSFGNCEVVGTYQTNAANNPTELFAITETGGTWGAGVELALPVNSATTANLSNLTCSSASNCEIVGTYQTSATNDPPGLFAITETGGIWGAGVELALPANAVSSYPLNFPLGLACSSAGNCEAVGTYQTNATNYPTEPFAITETNGTWGTGVELTLPGYLHGSVAASLTNLACSSAGNCEAVGTYNTNASNDTYEPFDVTEKGGTWGAGVELTLPANAVSDQFHLSLSNLTCSSAGDCEIVGTYKTNATNDAYEPFDVTETNGTWGTGVELALPANAAMAVPYSSVSSLTCSAAGNCEVVYSYWNEVGGFESVVYQSAFSKLPPQPGCSSTGVGSVNFPGGYWLAGANGAVYSCGDAPFYGSLVTLGKTPSKPIVGIAATPDNKGYWLVASDGGLFAFGDAKFYGSMGGKPLNKPVVGMAATPQGGYYEVASDGGLFAFGPGASFYGSMGGKPLNKPVVGMAETPAGGYYEVASDGGLFSFGTPFHGSTGCLSLNQPIVGMEVSTDTTTVGPGTACGFTTPQAPGGYQFVASDGGVFSFGNAVFAGSLGGQGVTDVVGIAGS